MKKIMAFVLALALTTSLAACGGGGTTNNESGQSDNAGSGNVASTAEISLSGEIGGEITISAYDAMQYKTFLEDAARHFEGRYPGTKVNVEIFSVMPEIRSDGQGGMVTAGAQDDSQSRQDYINKVNTAMMSGGGADILAMDVLPAYKYADSGQLENLTAYMEADSEFNRADYRANILDAVSYKNGTWFIPLDYAFNYYAYNSILLTGESVSRFGSGGAFTIEELIAVAEPAFNGDSKLFNIVDYAKGPNFGNMWESLLDENYTSFVDIENKTAHFDDGGFAALLESVKRYGEEGYVSQGTMTGQADAGDMMQAQRQGRTNPVFFKPKTAFSLTSLFTRDLGMSMTAVAEGGTMAFGDDDEVAGIAANADGSIPFTYSQAYGINANSQNKETAWAFLKFLLREEMQLSTNLSTTALPLLNSAREKKAETILSGMTGQNGEPVGEKLSEALEGYNKAVEQLSNQINAYVLNDTVINDMIAAEVAYFFDGTKTADEVAKMLQNKVTLYLNE